MKKSKLKEFSIMAITPDKLKILIYQCIKAASSSMHTNITVLEDNAHENMQFIEDWVENYFKQSSK